MQTLKNELEVEIRKRQQYISHGIKAVADVTGDNRYAPMSTSCLDLSQLTHDSSTSTSVLESKKLDDDYRTAAKHRLLQPSQSMRERSTARRASPLRAAAAAVTSAGLVLGSPRVGRAVSTHRIPLPVLPSMRK